MDRILRLWATCACRAEGLERVAGLYFCFQCAGNECGVKPFVDPYVPIPKKTYYFYQLFFLIPYGIVLFFIECSTAQLCLRLFKVKKACPTVLASEKCIN
jgi:hypothetical protein